MRDFFENSIRPICVVAHSVRLLFSPAGEFDLYLFICFISRCCLFGVYKSVFER